MNIYTIKQNVYSKAAIKYKERTVSIIQHSTAR